MNKKVVVTGHTSGIGKAIYDRFNKTDNYEVIGLSSSNGYNIDQDFEKVVRASTGAHLFINNVYCDSQQLKLVNALSNTVDMMVVMGSISRFYPEIIHTAYASNKQDLAEACRLVSIDPHGIPILHLDIGFIEKAETSVHADSHIGSDYTTSFNDIVDTIMFWKNTPCIRQVEFRWKLTPYVLSRLEQANPNLDPTRITF